MSFPLLKFLEKFLEPSSDYVLLIQNCILVKNFVLVQESQKFQEFDVISKKS